MVAMSNESKKQTSRVELIDVRTTRYSEFFKRLLDKYADGATVEIDGNRYSSSDFPKLIRDWCTNAKIRETRNFGLSRNGTEIFGFHDHPSELWAAISELPFVEQLASEGIVRFGILK
jgi:hypothetical protein